jgi:two-component system chemotaxis response regulator CheY
LKPTDPSIPPRTIIVVDDSRAARKQVVFALQNEQGFAFVEAVDGRDGLAKLEENPDAALVICDVNMPEMGGLEMLQALHESGKSASLPVILLTTEAEPELLKKAKERGARGWIVKPFKPENLVAAVRRVLP